MSFYDSKPFQYTLDSKILLYAPMFVVLCLHTITNHNIFSIAHITPPSKKYVQTHQLKHCSPKANNEHAKFSRDPVLLVPNPGLRKLVNPFP